MFGPLGFGTWTLRAGPCCHGPHGDAGTCGTYRLPGRARYLKSDPLLMRRLRACLSGLDEHPHRMTDDAVLRRIEHLLRVRRLHVCVAPASHSHNGVATHSGSAQAVPRRDEEPPPPSSRPQAKPLTWIEIALVDDREQPVAGERWRVVLPNGVVREGTLDGAGRARLDDIPHGQCKVSFPALDADLWQVA